MEQSRKPNQNHIDELRAQKAQWFSAKMGLIVLCANCRTEIFYPQERKDTFIHDCAMPKWLHVDGYYGRQPCYNDEADGVACPMSEIDLQDYFEDIKENDYLLEEDNDS